MFGPSPVQATRATILRQLYLTGRVFERFVAEGSKTMDPKIWTRTTIQGLQTVDWCSYQSPTLPMGNSPAMYHVCCCSRLGRTKITMGYSGGFVSMANTIIAEHRSRGVGTQFGPTHHREAGGIVGALDLYTLSAYLSYNGNADTILPTSTQCRPLLSNHPNHVEDTALSP